MLLPNPLLNVVDGDAFCLRQEEHHKETHHDDPRREEEENEGLHMTHHGQERLCNDECADHVCAYGNCKTSSFCLDGEDFARD